MDYIDIKARWDAFPHEKAEIESRLHEWKNTANFDQTDMPNVLYEQLCTTFTKLFYGKCAYCDEKLKHTDIVLDFWRPGNNARGYNDVFFNRSYYWLRADINNIYLACSRCALQRNGRFVTANQNSQDSKYDIQTLNLIEYPLLLDPYRNRPMAHIDLKEEVDKIELVGNDERGRHTIAVFNLNRRSLSQRRKERVVQILEIANEALKSQEPPDALEKLLTPQNEFCGTVRQKLCLFLQTQEALSHDWQLFLEKQEEILRDLRQEENETAVIPAQYSFPRSADSQATLTTPLLRSIEIRNFRGIEQMRLYNLGDTMTAEQLLGRTRCEEMMVKANTPLAPCIMLLGKNGSGKTSVLQAMAMALMGTEDQKFYREKIVQQRGDYISKGMAQSRVEVRCGDNFYKMALSHGEPLFTSSPTPPLFVLGYGCSRIVQDPPHRQKSTTPPLHIKNLFGYTEPMEECFSWLETLPDEDYLKVIEIIRRVLPDPNCEIVALPPARHEKEKRREVFAHFPYDEPVPLHCLAEGYKSLIGLVCDICQKYPHGSTQIRPHDQIEGIVLIDEIDSHLHSLFASNITVRLRLAFPALGFVFTTHNFNCLRGFGKNEVFHLWRFAGNTMFEPWTRDLWESNDAEINAHLRQMSLRGTSTRLTMREALHQRCEVVQHGKRGGNAPSP